MPAPGAPEPELTAALIEAVNRTLLIRTPLEPADLLFFFGTRHAEAQMIEAAADLWRRGFCRWVLITGGPTGGVAEDEATVLSRGLVAAGVPAEAILTEHRASNTGENVIFALPILEAKLGLARIESLIALGKTATSARYLMTLQRHWPRVRKMLVTVNHLPHPIEEWPLHPDMRARVLSEWRKLADYRERGFIADLP
jgi:uncharacterized SAM-binding protein YcdF (DUF218 family)